MDPADHEETVRRFMAALASDGDLGVLDEICAPAVATEWQTNMATFAFTDRVFTVDEVVAQDSQVAVLWTIAGTHTGEFNGLPPTGKRTSNTGSAFFSFQGGRIVALVTHYDADNLYEQLGARVTPAPSV
jgi:steroid delta-isomerase-like uncharacterized protein